MRFDDRLKTAITQPVVDEHDRVVRWRQLVDLLSRLPDTHDEALADAAFALVERESPAIPETVRAASARNASAHSVDPRVIALFARDKLAVAAPLLASANLSAMEWHQIGRDSSPEVASFILALSRGMPSPPLQSHQLPDEATPQEVASATAEDSPPSISQMVARIEQLRSKRDVPPTEPAAEYQAPVPPRASPAASSKAAEPARDGALFRWESDADGRIAWVDGVPRGAFIGQTLSDVSDALINNRALTEREPFADAPLVSEHPTVSGEWRMSGIPAFSPVDGRFLGYRGIARRPGSSPEPRASAAQPRARQPQPRDLDALRETIHEIKTPLNAIIGFAEIIDGQYLGPAHRNYRQRAADIVAQARMLLEAVHDLDIAARMQSGRDNSTKSSRAVDVIRAVQPELEQAAAQAGADLSISLPGRDERIGMSGDLAARLMSRFIGSVVAAAQPGERVLVSTEWHGDEIIVAISRPEASANLSAAALLDPAFVADGGKNGLLGLGFALRLVRGLVRMVRGDLVIEDSRFSLMLPAV